MSVEGQDAESAPSSCPECGADVPGGAVICVNCGYHLVEGRYLTTTVDRSSDAKPAADLSESKSTLPKSTIRKAEAIIRDAELVWVALLMSFCTCGIGSIIMLPWYLWRFASWNMINGSHEELRSSLSADGELAVRFQRAWGKLVLGICIGALLWIGMTLDGFRRVYLATPHVVQVDPARHEGPDRIKFDPYNFSLVQPDSFQLVASTEQELALEGPTWQGNNLAVPVKINVRAVLYRTPQQVEMFPQHLATERIAAVAQEYEILEHGHTIIDEKPGYYVKMRLNLLPNQPPERQKWLTLTEYFVIGYDHIYTVAFLTAQDALPENQPAFDQVLQSIRVD